MILISTVIILLSIIWCKINDVKNLENVKLFYLQQIIHRPDTQCHGYALHGIQW